MVVVAGEVGKRLGQVGKRLGGGMTSDLIFGSGTRSGCVRKGG